MSPDSLLCLLIKRYHYILYTTYSSASHIHDANANETITTTTTANTGEQAVNVVDLDERMHVQKAEWNPDPLGIGMGSPTAQCTGTSTITGIVPVPSANSS